MAAITELARLEARTAALKTVLVASLDAVSEELGRGLGMDSWQSSQQGVSTTEELACALHIPYGSAAVLEADAAALTGPMNATLHALASGALSYRHAQIILDEVASLHGTGPGPDIVPEAVREGFEARLLDVAPTLTAGELRAKARRWREKEHPHTIEPRHRAAAADRNLSLTPDRDGMSRLALFLPSDTGQGIWNRATATARAAQGPTESRTLTQLRLDIAAAWLLNGTITPNTGGNSGTGDSGNGNGNGGRGRSHGHGEAFGIGGNGNGAGQAGGAVGDGECRGSADGRPAGGHDPASGIGAGAVIPDCTMDGVGAPRAEVLVTVPVFSLMGLTDEPAELEGYGPIPPSMARKLAAEAPEFVRILVHPHTGEPLSIGKEHYRVPARMRTWLRNRDGKCVFPGCSTVTAHTEADHLKAFEHGGTTGQENLGNTCVRHHYLKHHPDQKDRNGRRKDPPDGYPETGPGAEPGYAAKPGTKPGPEPGEGSVSDAEPDSGAGADGRPDAGTGPKPWPGWKPKMTDNGLPSWTAPSGRTYPPPPRSFTPPILPNAFTHPGTGEDDDEEDPIPVESRVSAGNDNQRNCQVLTQMDTSMMVRPIP